jgi:hypothetical protein
MLCSYTLKSHGQKIKPNQIINHLKKLWQQKAKCLQEEEEFDDSGNAYTAESYPEVPRTALSDSAVLLTPLNLILLCRPCH